MTADKLAPTWRRAAAAAGLFAAALLTALGCDSGPRTGEVSGTISYDGKPVEKGAITFVPIDGKATTEGGNIVGGKYTAAKVPVGNAKVYINGTKVIGKKKAYNTKDSPEVDLYDELLPDKYSNQGTTELTFEVKPGKNEKDWDLKK